METTNKKYCRNCNYPISDEAKYCSQCSQKNTDGKVPVWEFLKEFFTNLLDVDSKLFLTFFALFIPGKLTVEYFKGKHKSYASPVRLFLYAGITLFAVVISKTQDIHLGEGQEYYAKQAERTKIKKIVQDNIKRFQIAYQDTSQYYQSDSLNKWIRKSINSKSYTPDSIRLAQINGMSKPIKVASEDFVDLPLDTILKKYEVSPGIQSIVIGQQIKTMKDGKGLFHYFIGKLPMIIFFMMPFLALVLKLLYIRGDRFFVEHLVFSFHLHTFAFMITLVLVLLGQYMHGLIIAAFILSIFIYQFMAMWRFYAQGFFKTLLKFYILYSIYIFLIIFAFVIAVLVTFLLF